MAIAIDIINKALRLAGVLASGETADAHMANDGLVTLNTFLDSLSNESLTMESEETIVIDLDGSQAYLIDPLNGYPAIDRPIDIHYAFYRNSESIDYPIDIVTTGEYMALPDKSLTGDVIEWIWTSATGSSMGVLVYPIASTGQLHLVSHVKFIQFGTIASNVNLGIGYQRMIEYGLASEFMVEYGLVNPAIEAKYIEAKANIKRTNTKPDVMRVSVPFGGYQGATLGRFRSGSL